MENFFNKIAPWFDKDKYGIVSLSFFLSMTSFLFFITKNNVKSENDLITLRNKVEYYSFKNESRGRRLYYIKLIDYSCHFKIKADFIDDFKAGAFYSLQKGDIINISIPKKSDPFKQKDILVFGIRNKDYVFLNEIDTIKKHNNKIDLYAGLIFLSISIFSYIYRRQN